MSKPVHCSECKMLLQPPDLKEVEGELFCRDCAETINHFIDFTPIEVRRNWSRALKRVGEQHKHIQKLQEENARLREELAKYKELDDLYPLHPNTPEEVKEAFWKIEETQALFFEAAEKKAEEMQAEIDRLRESLRWRKVEEETPEESGTYDALLLGQVRVYTYYCKHRGFYATHHVTHWRSIGELPE